MSTDLTEIYDHPTVLLRQRARDHATQDSPSPTFPTERDEGFNGGLSGAADYLSAYEVKHDVTFAALSNNALHNLREAYAGFKGGSDAHVLASHLLMLRTAVSDLLGLED